MENNFEIKIKHLIESKKEGDYWDFKQEWHRENERLIHDILCFANTLHDQDSYIIIGVSDNGVILGVNEENRMKQADLIDLLSYINFAGDNTPLFEINTIFTDNKEIDVLTIFNSDDIPYYLETINKKQKKLQKGFIYTRVGDRNTPINQNANIQQIENLWKKRLGLTQPSLFQIVSKLENKQEWEENESNYYNKFNPDYKLVEELENDNRKALFYFYTQPNTDFMYGNLKIKDNQTILKEFLLIILDGGRYTTPAPKWSFFDYDKRSLNKKYAYTYFLKDSIEYKLQQFYFDGNNDEEVYAKNEFDKVILYFDNDQERLTFQAYIEKNIKIVEIYLLEAEKEYFEINVNNELERINIKQKLSVGLALNEALLEFRNSK